MPKLSITLSIGSVRKQREHEEVGSGECYVTISIIEKSCKEIRNI